MSFALCLTVDVDGEAGLPNGGRGHEDRLTARSERRYGMVRGLHRLLDLLAAHAASATFYVPGVTALRHPDAMRSIVGAGQELGHHGHRHVPTLDLPSSEEVDDLEQGFEALEAAARVRPRGYRSPGWELTPVTLRALAEHGIRWDSSLMEDDRPYWIEDGGSTLLELPVHWDLDDAPHFDRTVDPEPLRIAWLAELRVAKEEDRPLTVTVHPDVVGRPHRLGLVAALLDEAAKLDAPLLSHGQLFERECRARA